MFFVIVADKFSLQSMHFNNFNDVGYVGTVLLKKIDNKTYFKNMPLTISQIKKNALSLDLKNANQNALYENECLLIYIQKEIENWDYNQWFHIVSHLGFIQDKVCVLRMF